MFFLLVHQPRPVAPGDRASRCATPRFRQYIYDSNYVVSFACIPLSVNTMGLLSRKSVMRLMRSRAWHIHNLLRGGYILCKQLIPKVGQCSENPAAGWL